MEDEFRKCAWCGKEYVPEDKRQKYCSVLCRERAKNFNRSREYKRPPKGRICDRDDCQIFTLRMANHCNGLVEVPEECSFYKERK